MIIVKNNGVERGRKKKKDSAHKELRVHVLDTICLYNVYYINFKV